MPSGVGFGASQGLEQVLARLFQEQQAKQRANEQAKAFDLQQQRMAQDQGQFDQSMDFNRQKFDADRQDTDFAQNLQSGQLAMQGTRFANDVAQQDVDQNAKAAEMAMAGTRMANQNNQNDLDRQSQVRMLRMRMGAEGGGSGGAPGQAAPGAPAPASEYTQEHNQRALDMTTDLLSHVNNMTAGAGSLLAHIPGTQATDFAAKLDSLKANIGFNELAQMRAESKTGGALGQISDKEEKLLSAVLGSLDPRQSPQALTQQLTQVRDSIMRWQQAHTAGGLGVPVDLGGRAPQAPQAPRIRRFNPETGQVE